MGTGGFGQRSQSPQKQGLGKGVGLTAMEKENTACNSGDKWSQSLTRTETGIGYRHGVLAGEFCRRTFWFWMGSQP